MHFDGVDDRTAAEALLGVELTADRSPTTCELDERRALGARAGRRRGASTAPARRSGTVVAVEANPAHDLLVLDGGALVPMVFVVEQRDGVVVIDPPDGLFDL